MNVQLIKESWPQAHEHYEQYREAMKRTGLKYFEHLARAAYHLEQGRAIIDIYATLKQAGLNAEGDPRLAISRADLKEIEFRKANPGGGVFRFGYKDMRMPNGTFPPWPHEAENHWSLKRVQIATRVPIVPPQHMPKGSLASHYILWEVEKWDAVPVDPILLRRINQNLFAVLATWDLTPLEQALVNGRTN